MISTKEVSVTDVYPNPDNQREYSMGDIQELAESFAANATRQGEPINPPMLFEHDGKYMILSGERRWRAMQLLGTKTFAAIVTDEMDEANAILAMLVSDISEKHTDLERSRFVQLAILGLDNPSDDELNRVAKSARISLEEVKKVQVARAAIDDAGNNATLDRMFAIADFEELGDSEAIEAVANAKEDKWQNVVSVQHKRIDNDKKTQALVAFFAEQQIPCTVCKNIDEPEEEGFVRRNAMNPDGALSIMEKFTVDHAIIANPKCKNPWDSISCYLFCTKNEDDAEQETLSPEEIAEQQRRQWIIEGIDTASVRIEEFVCGRIAKTSTKLKHTCRYLYNFCVAEWQIKRHLEEWELDAEKIYQPSSFIIIHAWSHLVTDFRTAECIIEQASYYRSHAMRYKALMDALCADGYKLEEQEVAFLEFADSLIESVVEDEDEYLDEDCDIEDDYDFDEDVQDVKGDEDSAEDPNSEDAQTDEADIVALPDANDVSGLEEAA